MCRDKGVGGKSCLPLLHSGRAPVLLYSVTCNFAKVKNAQVGIFHRLLASRREERPFQGSLAASNDSTRRKLHDIKGDKMLLGMVKNKGFIWHLQVALLCRLTRERN